MNNSTPRLRIPPSPTGNLHVGTARTALFNELFAHKHKGAFIIRIEDTDPARSKPEFQENILEGFKWLGITWQEGPDIGGKYGPYIQSERVARHNEAVKQLLALGKAYYCTCLEREQSCDCKQKNNTEGAVRLIVAAKEVSFEDPIRGTVTVHTDSFGGDFVIARSDGSPLYHLAVVCDDHDMSITHIIRGEDHIHNTIKHILIQEALGYSRPIYAHLPLLLDEQRKKLSKRSGETSLLVYRDNGFLPQTMVNYLALLGWNPGDEREYFTHEELIQEFSLERVQKGGAIFSLVKLSAMNKHYLSQLSDEDLLVWATTHYDMNSIPVRDPERLLSALKTELGRFASYDVDGQPLHEAMNWHASDWNPSYDPNLLVWKKSPKEATEIILQELFDIMQTIPEWEYTAKHLETFLITWIDTNKKGRGDVLWPLRVALTGREHSPAPFAIASVIGKSDVLRRLQHARDSLK